jgi:hypothetical protein
MWSAAAAVWPSWGLAWNTVRWDAEVIYSHLSLYDSGGLEWNTIRWAAEVIYSYLPLYVCLSWGLEWNTIRWAAEVIYSRLPPNDPLEVGDGIPSGELLG